MGSEKVDPSEAWNILGLWIKVAIIAGAKANIGEATAKLFDQKGTRQYNLIKIMKYKRYI